MGRKAKVTIFIANRSKYRLYTNLQQEVCIHSLDVIMIGTPSTPTDADVTPIPSWFVPYNVPRENPSTTGRAPPKNAYSAEPVKCGKSTVGPLAMHRHERRARPRNHLVDQKEQHSPRTGRSPSQENPPSSAQTTDHSP